jgi:hypothetical protein
MSKKHEPDAGFRIRQELRKGSRTSPHDTRPNRQRSRQDAKRAAIRDSDRGFSLPGCTQEYAH